MFSENEDLYLALMTWKEPDWQGFDPIDTETWWKNVLKELQGEPKEKLDWQVDPEVAAAPFYLEVGKEALGPLTGGRKTSDWSIMEWIPAGLPEVDANALALESLRGGAQSLALPTTSSLPSLLAEVYMDIAPAFWRTDGSSEIPAFLENLAAWTGQGRTFVDGAPIPGGFLDPLTPAEEARARELFPEWAFAFSALPAAAGPVGQLQSALGQAREAIQRSGTPQGHLLCLEVGNDFLLEIVRLRAWRILWGHLMESFGCPSETPCTIVASVSPDPALPWENTYIAAATRALSAVLGGVDHLAVIPPQAPDPWLARRVARNVQHLMKEEGRLHLVTDPMAGSHAVERLTLEVAERAWNAFPA